MTGVSSSSSFLFDAVRTPIGRIGGGLAGVRPDDMAAHVVGSLLERSPGLDPEAIDDVIFGASNGAGEDNRNVARMAVLLAGLPTSVPGTTVNRLCGSGLEAVVQATRAVETRDAAVVIAGGAESMSRAPWVFSKPDHAYARHHETMHSTTLGWRLVNPLMDDRWTIALGESAEILADRYSITREAQDEFALASHQRAARAWGEARFADEIVPYPGAVIEHDESVRPDTSLEKLGRLKPAFRQGGTVTAGNSSPLNDAAGALLIGSEAAADQIGREPIARFVSRGIHAVDPDVFGIAPVEAAEMALSRAGISWGDLVAVELNEAFAAQTLACLALWPDLDPDILNVNGGAIAIGHPIACSGARIIGALARELRRRGGGYGLASICIGVGQGLAVVLEV